ncbi:hypothetical protein D3Z09_18300 [Rahnella aquatilis]|nr:hypothetical protein D3Z09_18300 [Rahnella aquatilis]
MMAKRTAMSPLWAALGGVMVMSSSTAQAAGNQALVTWDVSAPTCEVTADPVISLGDVNATPIFSPATTKTWLHAGEKSFELTVYDCAGIPSGSSLIPDILVTGDEANIVDDSNRQLFKTGGDSSGMYIVLYKDDPKMGSETGNPHIANNTYLYIPKTPGSKTYFGGGDVLASGTEYKIPLKAAVACGRQVAEGCKNPNARAGTLSASFSFIFAYR